MESKTPRTIRVSLLSPTTAIYYCFKFFNQIKPAKWQSEKEYQSFRHFVTVYNRKSLETNMAHKDIRVQFCNKIPEEVRHRNIENFISELKKDQLTLSINYSTDMGWMDK